MDSGSTSHMVTTEENMSNICNVEKIINIGDSGSLTRTKCGNWHGYQKHLRKQHQKILSDMDVIPGLHTNFL